MNDITSASPEAAKLVSAERTFHDIELAKALGYKRPSNIRNLIRRYLPALEAMGLVLQREAPIVSGKGRVQSVTEFHLSKAQAAFIIAKADTGEAENALILISETYAMVSDEKLAPVDEAAEMELAAARARALARHREDRDDYSRILKGFSRSPSRSVIGHKPDGTAILRELTPFEKQREERQAAQRRQSRWAAQGRKSLNPGDPD